MAPVAPIGALECRRLTRAVTFMDKHHAFLRKLLFPVTTEDPLATTSVQIDNVRYTPKMAPFTLPESEAAMMPRFSGDSLTVETPNISLKMPLSATQELLMRQAGESEILIPGGTDVISRRLKKKVGEDVRIVIDAVNEREEWMIAQILRGAISYSSATRAAFTITFDKPAGNTITLSTFWNQTDPTPLVDIETLVKRTQSNNNGPVITDAICGESASDAFMALLESGALKLDLTRSLAVGQASFEEQFDETGVKYMGSINRIRFWEYSQSVIDEEGNSEELIRTKFIEFVSVTRKALAENKMYYGVILDIEAIQRNLHIGRRFAKVELKSDPSVYITYLKTRPLPVFRRPDWNISMQVVS